MDILLLFLTATIVSAANAVVGGAFFTFPTLTSISVPALLANTTNTVAVSPSHALANFAYRQKLTLFRRRLVLLSGASALCALAGATLLALTNDHIFSRLVP